MKRAVHEEVINKVQQQRSKDHAAKEVDSVQSLPNYKHKQVSGTQRKACSFKDDDNCISSVPTNQHFEAGLSVRANQGFESNRLEAAILDLNADDGTGLKKQKSSYHWDKKSKKYVKLNNGEWVTASGKIKTESGAKVKANKTGIYKGWNDQSHKKVSLKGTNDGTVEGGTTPAGNPGFRGDYRRFNGRNNLSPYQMLIFGQKSKILSKLGRKGKRKQTVFLILRASLRKGRRILVEREKGGKQKKVVPRHSGSFNWL